MCGGHPAYQAVEWYFPEHGEFFDPTTYINDCTGNYVYPPAPCTASALTSAWSGEGIPNFRITWFACDGNWAVAAGYSTDLGFSVGVLEQTTGEWYFNGGGSDDGTCLAVPASTPSCPGSPGRLTIPNSELISLVQKAGLSVSSAGDVTPPAGWHPSS
jgi:hypothetical protein